MALDGSTTLPGYLGGQIAEWWKDDAERGEVNHVAVATGDLDGDGVDDGIVVASTRIAAATFRFKSCN